MREAATELAHKDRSLRQPSRKAPHTSLAPRLLPGDPGSRASTDIDLRKSGWILVFLLVTYGPRWSRRGASNGGGVVCEDCLRALLFNARVPQQPPPLRATRECPCFLWARRIRGVFLFGYFILDKQNKVTRQPGDKFDGIKFAWAKRARRERRMDASNKPNAEK